MLAAQLSARTKPQVAGGTIGYGPRECDGEAISDVGGTAVGTHQTPICRGGPSTGPRKTCQ